MRRSRHTGFSLVELMITLAIAVVLIALAVPSFRDLIEKSRLRGATDDLVALLNTARLNAVKQQRNIDVALGGTAAAWCAGANTAADPTPGQAVTAVAKCDCTTPSTCAASGFATTLSATGYRDVTLSDVTAEFTFDSKLGTLATALDPGAAVTPSSFDVISGKYRATISVSALGQTRVCADPFVSGYPQC